MLKYNFLSLIFILPLFLCTNKNNPVSENTHNNIWLVGISPDFDKTLTLKDTLKVKVAYQFDTDYVETNDTTFDVFMIFKKQDEPIDIPILYAEVSCCSKTSRKWADTVTLEYPVRNIMKINPQIKPFQFSFQILTGADCTDGNGICMRTMFAQSYYYYKNGLDTLK